MKYVVLFPVKAKVLCVCQGVVSLIHACVPLAPSLVQPLSSHFCDYMARPPGHVEQLQCGIIAVTGLLVFCYSICRLLVKEVVVMVPSLIVAVVFVDQVDYVIPSVCDRLAEG